MSTNTELPTSASHDHNTMLAAGDSAQLSTVNNVSEPDYLTVLQDSITKKFHGAYYRNKPTPSGCDRFILHLTTTQGYQTSQMASDAISRHFPYMDKPVCDD